METTGKVRLLDLEPAFGATLEREVFDRARRALVLPTIALQRGPLDPGALRHCAEVRGALLGVLVAEGAVLTDVQLGGRTSTRLALAGELLLLGGEPADSVPSSVTWSVRSSARVVALDDRLLAACARWPRMLTGFSDRLAQQARSAARQQAISQLPRVEDRLLALLWSIADECGQVRPEGVFFEMPLTHEEIGRMIGAKRPTVSLGLTGLARQGLIEQQDGGWVVAARSLERFNRDGDPPRVRTGRRPAPAGRHPHAESAAVLAISNDGLAVAPSLGGRVVFVPDESAALAALETTKPVVILIDIADGADPQLGERLVQRLRRDPELAHVRLLVMHSDPRVPPSMVLLSAAHEYVQEALEHDDLFARVSAQMTLAAAARSQPRRRARPA